MVSSADLQRTLGQSLTFCIAVQMKNFCLVLRHLLKHFEQVKSEMA